MSFWKIGIAPLASHTKQGCMNEVRRETRLKYGDLRIVRSCNRVSEGMKSRPENWTYPEDKANTEEYSRIVETKTKVILSSGE